MSTSQAFELDMEVVSKLAETVDVNRLLQAMSQIEPQKLGQLLHEARRSAKPHSPPPVDSDFYETLALLDETGREKLGIMRRFLETHVAPIADAYWERGEFPKQIIPEVAKVVAEIFGDESFAFPPTDPLMFGQVFSLEMSRIDPSFCTFFGVHWGLCMASIYMFGSEEQKAKWLPVLFAFEKIGSWALTEPLNGSDAAQGLQTTAVQDGDEWVLNGQKKWSGNAPFADVNVILAKDTADGQVKGFLVEMDNPGYHVEKLEGKISKRIVENALITMTDCRVREADRLPGIRSFRDVARQLAAARAMVAWEAVGVAMGAYERALAYANQRVQFGEPITQFQLVQVKFVQMLGHITAMQAMVTRLAQLEARDGYISHARASLAKAHCTARMREVVALARGVLGGNGILLEHGVARFFADAEAVYSYEGTYEMNALIVGREITGRSAFA